MLTPADYQRLTEKARTYCDNARVVRKRSSWLMWTIHILFCIVTFGFYRSFLSRFATSFFVWVWIPEEWSLDAAEGILPHECRHIWQSIKGLHLGFGLFYLFFPLPLFLCWGRFWCELDADREGWKALLRRNGRGAVPWVRNEARRRAASVCGLDYFWAWPKSWGLARYISESEKVVDTLTAHL